MYEVCQPGPAILGGHALPFLFFFAFAQQKEKRETKGKKKTFKAETIKRLSPRSKCYCFSHSRASRIQRFFCWSSLVADSTCQCSMAPPLWKSISPALSTNSSLQGTSWYYITLVSFLSITTNIHHIHNNVLFRWWMLFVGINENKVHSSAYCHFYQRLNLPA